MAYDDYTRDPAMRSTHTDADATGTLNTLISTLIDSVDGYQKAATDTENARFAEMFNARARERRQAVTRLQAVVAGLGGDPSDDGTTSGALHRGWLGLKEAITGRDDEAIVKEVERGEDYLKAKFEAAMTHKDLPAEARAALDEAWVSVRAGHDEMSALKHAID